MLSFAATDVNGREIILPQALSAELRMDEDVPADALYAVFPYVKSGELKEIRAYGDPSTVFVGVIDEEELIADDSGEYLRLSARSLAAVLLDNEAVPESYDHPSAKLIYERHVKPYGIIDGDADSATYFGQLAVTKGMSRWTALKNFCNACYSSVPRVSADGRLYMKGQSGGKEIVFSDSGVGVTFTQLSESVKRCEEISRVRVKVNSVGGYRQSVDEPDALARGIVRERYLNATLTDTPLKCADVMLRNSRKKAYSLTLSCPLGLPDIIGCDAKVSSRIAGDREGLYVSSLRYRMDKHEEKTTVVLKRRLP